MKQICLSCRLFTMIDGTSGKCRAGSSLPQERSIVAADHCCSSWQDAGQQYYIRLGWIKGNASRQEQPTARN